MIVTGRAALLAVVLASQPRAIEPQKASLSRDEEIAFGLRAAKQVERSVDVVRDAEIEAWLNRIGAKLAATEQANSYPYYFKLVNDDSMNAFALPGGPMYVNSGLIKEADSEGEVVGALAHEMSHVALRHGIAQWDKDRRLHRVLGIAGEIASVGAGDMAAEAVKLGGGLGVRSALSKFSRDFERDADLNGARMMAAAGYNPLDLAGFFEKLDAAMAQASRPRGLDRWFADHPSFPDRRSTIEQDIRLYPKRPYTAGTGEFEKIRRRVLELPEPRRRPEQALQPDKTRAASRAPSGFRALQLAGFSIMYPADWRVAKAESGPIYLFPRGGARVRPDGGVDLIAGASVDYVDTDDASAATGSKPVLRSAAGGRSVYTCPRVEGLWTLILAAPPDRDAAFGKAFHTMVDSVRFND